VTLSILASARLRDAGFAHGFSTRMGGVSEPPHDTLDFAMLRDTSRLRENQRRLAEAVGLDVAQLHQTRQVHGNVLVTADGDPAAMVDREADALVAEPGSGHAVMVRVADCVPVLLGDPASGRVAAVHAGWRGVEAGVVPVAVRHLVTSPGAGEVNGLLAAIGPCIGACCFEVGEDVAERIASASSSAVVVRRAGDKAYVDLRAAVRAQLVVLGLADAAVDDVPAGGREACTRCNAARFYSYRRDGDASGRLAAVIAAR
jgi:polyphenol oxidase